MARAGLVSDLKVFVPVSHGLVRIGWRINLFYASHQLFRLAGTLVPRYASGLNTSPAFPYYVTRICLHR